MKTVLLAAVLALVLPAAAQPAPRPRVRIVTSCGPVVVELAPEAAPGTVANFLRYVQDKFYDGTIFHRVIQGFMVQGGGLLPDLREKPTRAPIPNEAQAAARAGLLNRRGTVAMARTQEADSATAQFYINTVDNPGLDPGPKGPGYCPFGRVVEGMAAVDAIEKVKTVWRHGVPNVPEYPVLIQSAEVLPAQP